MEKSSGSSDSHDITLGCGTDLVTPSITLNINTTTGGNFSVIVENNSTVEILKKIISKKLKVSKDRICLLHRERELVEGTLKDNGLIDGSKIILIPNVETGLLAQRPEHTVMQALESLNDTQVNDFLSGKSPLNLSMRLGDHMMLIQLQLSTLNPSGSLSSSSFSSNLNTTSSPHHTTNENGISKNRSSLSKSKSSQIVEITPIQLLTNRLKRHHSIELETSSRIPSQEESSSSASSLPSTTVPTSPTNTTKDNLNTIKREIENLHNMVKSLSEIQQREKKQHVRSSSNKNDDLDTIEQSPIKSLSNLVSSPIKTAQIFSNSGSPSSTASFCETTTPPDPISAKLTSCLCKSLDTNCSKGETSCHHHQQNQESSSSLSTLSFGRSHLHKTLNNPMNKNKIKHSSHTLLRKAIKALDNQRDQVKTEIVPLELISNTPPSSSTLSTPPRKIKLLQPTTSSIETEIATESDGGTTTVIDTRALAEASRNLTQTLRKLSKEVFTNKIDVSEDNSRRMGTGAVIESMKHHGKGIYSGTFSGTLNPALQDRYGRPKRDISTIIHILNDLLSAAPQCRRSARIKFDSSAVSASNNNISRTANVGDHHHHKSLSGREISSHRRHTQLESELESVCRTCSTLPTASTASHEIGIATNLPINTNSNHSSSCLYGECKGHINGTTKTESNNTVQTIACQSHSNIRQTVIPYMCSHQNNDDNTISLDDSLLDGSTLNLASISCRCNYSNLLNQNRTTTIATSSFCIKCNSSEIENNKTKCKLDHLRLIMQQKKQRREARKLKSLPYNSQARVVGTATASTLSQLNSTNDIQQQPTHIVEEVDSVA